MAFLLGGTAVNLYFKPILDEFRWSRASLSLASAVILVSMALLSPFIGKLIDRFGPRLMLLINVLAQISAAAVTGTAGNLGQIYIGRFLTEFKPTHSTQVLINRWFKVFRGRALGIASTGIPLGTLLLSPLAQILIQNWGWRITLFFWAGVSLVVLLPLLIFIKNRPQDIGLNPDGLESTEDYHIEASAVPKTPKHDNSGLDLSKAVKTTAFWLLSGTHLICGIGCGFVMTHIVIFATDLGYSAMIGAIFMSIIGGMSIIGVLVAGQFSDYKKRNRVLSLTHLVRSLSFITVVIAVLAGGGPLWLLFLAMGLFGVGWFTTL
jgi:sugar phosphate permease